MTAEKKAELLDICLEAFHGTPNWAHECSDGYVLDQQARMQLAIEAYNTRAPSPPASGEVVEKVAREMCSRQARDDNDGVVTFDTLPNMIKDMWREDARHILQAAGVAAVPEGWKLVKNSTHDDRSWPEDFKQENGHYRGICHSCGRSFSGHKRRLTCKVCTEFPSVMNEADKQRSREEAQKFLDGLSAAPER